MGRVLSTLRKSTTKKESDLEDKQNVAPIKTEEKIEVSNPTNEIMKNLQQPVRIEDQFSYSKNAKISMEQKLEKQRLARKARKERIKKGYRGYFSSKESTGTARSPYPEVLDNIEVVCESKSYQDGTEEEAEQRLDDIQVEDTINLAKDPYEERKMKNLEDCEKKWAVHFSSKAWKNTSLVSRNYYGSNLLWREEIKGFLQRQRRLHESFSPTESKQIEGLCSHLAYFAPKLCFGKKVLLAGNHKQTQTPLINIITKEHSDMITAKIMVNTTMLKRIAVKADDNPSLWTILNSAFEAIDVLRCIFQSRWIIKVFQDPNGGFYKAVTANVILKKPSPLVNCSFKEASIAGLC